MPVMDIWHSQAKCRLIRIIAGLVAGLTPLMLAACGGSTAAPKNAQVSGTPVKLMLLIDLSNTAGLYVGWRNAYQATVAAINASGGINGHPLQLEVCDTANDANATAGCGRKAVSEKVSAVVSLANYGSQYEPLLQAAGIPDIGNTVNDKIYFTSPVSFPLWVGGIGAVFAMGTITGYLKCKKAVEVAVQQPSLISNSQAQFVKGTQLSGVEAGTIVQGTPGAPDMAPYMAAALGQGADCVALLAHGADVVGLIKAARQSGKSVQLIIPGPIPADSAASLGADINGVHFASILRLASSASKYPLVKQWVDEINKYSDSPKALDVQSANAWASVHLFAYVARKAKTTDSQSILDQLNKTANYDLGVGPVVSFDKPAPTNPLGPRIFNPTVIYGHYANGQPVSDTGDFVNVFTGKPLS